jgi:hypothetical protein
MYIYQIIEILLQISMKINNLKTIGLFFSSTDLLDNKGIIKETSNSLRNHLT